MSFESEFDSPVLHQKQTQTHFFGEVPHRFEKKKLTQNPTTSLKQQRLAENIDPRFRYYHYFTDSQSEMMSNTEKRINDFLKKSIIIFFDVLNFKLFSIY